MDEPQRPVAVSAAAATRASAAELLERVGPIIRRALVARYGLELGAEAAADAVAWGWEHSDVLAEMANPGGYLYRVGQSSVRRTRRRIARSAFPIEPEWHDAPDLPGDVFDALYQLRPDQRVAVLLVHGYRFSYRETAAVMGVSEDSVRNHVHRGMRRLRSELEPPTRRTR